MYLLSVGLIPFEKCIEQTIEYTHERKAFGRSILDNQVVHFRLAELESEVEALRSLAYRTVGKYWDTISSLGPFPASTLKSWEWEWEWG